MSSRIAGAVLALIAAGSIALSLLVFAWWAGTPTIDGQKKDIKVVEVGLLTAEGCDNRGCQPVPLKSGFATTRYIELGAGGVLVLSALVLSILALAGSERRQVLSKIVISAAGASIIVALALLLMGPDFDTKQSITVPIDLRGMLTFWVGTGLAIIAGILAMRPTPRVVLRPPRVVSASAQPAAPAPVPASQPVDVLAFLDEPPPPPPPASPPSQAMTTPLPGPSGPLGAQFNSGPQLRPLYDAAPSQGGSGGFVPGMATPPQLTAQGMTPVPPPPPPKPLPPPIRNRPASAAPPIPRGLPSPTRPPPINRAQSTFAAAVVPPPPPPQTVLPPMREETGDDHLETVERDKHAAESLDSTFDAAATAALPDVPIDGSGTEQTEIGGSLSVGDSTNVSSIAFEASGPTSESERYEDNADEDMLATMSRDRVGATDRDLPTVAEPASAAASIAAAVLAPAASGNSSRIAISQPAPVSVRTPPAPPAPAPISVPKIFPVKTPPPKVPISTAPDSLPPPSEKQVKNSGPSPACPQCESPMAWVEAHLRFYCKSCRMYF